MSLTMPRAMTKWIINENLISSILLIYAFLSDPKDLSAFSLWGGGWGENTKHFT